MRPARPITVDVGSADPGWRRVSRSGPRRRWPSTGTAAGYGAPGQVYL